MQYKRIHIWGAVSISVVLHMLVGGVYTMSVNHSHRLTVTQPASMSVRIQSLSPVVDVANQISVRTANRVRMPKRQTQQRLENHVVSGHEDP